MRTATLVLLFPTACSYVLWFIGGIPLWLRVHYSLGWVMSMILAPVCVVAACVLAFGGVVDVFMRLHRWVPGFSLRNDFQTAWDAAALGFWWSFGLWLASFLVNIPPEIYSVLVALWVLLLRHRGMFDIRRLSAFGIVWCACYGVSEVISLAKGWLLAAIGTGTFVLH